MMSRGGVDPVRALTAIAPGTHLLLAGVALLEVAARGVRVAAVAGGLGERVPVATSVRAQLAADALGAVTPMRAGADPAKLAMLRKSGIPVGVCGAIVLGEMASEVLVLLASSALLALLVDHARWVSLGLLGYALIVACPAALVLVLSRLPPNQPPSPWRRLRLGPKKWTKFRAAAALFRERSVRLLRIPPRWVAPILVAAVVHIACRLAVLPLLVTPLLDSPPPGGLLGDLVLRPFFVLYATALLPPPGGGGGVELTFAAALGGVLDPATLGVTLLWWRLYTFHLTALAGGVMLLRPKRDR